MFTSAAFWSCLLGCLCLTSCQRDEQCEKFEYASTAAQQVDTFGGCGDSRARAVRCQPSGAGWTCSCVFNGVDVEHFTYSGDIPKSEAEARTFANASCAWKLTN